MKQRIAQFMAQSRQRTARFMAGRNGNDQLNFFLLIVDVALLLLASIFSRRLGGLLYPLVLVLLGYTYFRMLSRNLYKRRTENENYLRLYGRAMSKLRLLKERWVQRRDYKFFTCPSCRAVMRVPKGRGKIKIVCRKCGSSFTGKS
ncbi:MAG: hypothetical protein J6P58_02185 [Oscillospiraceae bacterium]|nr:hypothetical protein [Oscillospiraceae bacterium]